MATGVASQTVSVNVASVVASVVSALSVDPSASTLAKRQASVCSGGTAQATGAGPVPSPDTASAFLAYAPFASTAYSAPTPPGWTQVFENLQASNNGYYYLGYTTLSSYDTDSCASQCSAIEGCQGINIYYERDASVAPGTGTDCDNPSSTTNIKCVFWGAPLDVSTATNTGQYRDQFQVVIAGSNAYNYMYPPTPSGYSAPTYLNNGAINAPLDCNGDNTYMGLRIFQNAPFDLGLCAAACTASSNFDIAQGIPSLAAPQTCQFFNTYMLYKNGQPLAQYCALYNETWSSTYATNVGQYDSAGNHYTVEDSYAVSNASNPGICTVVTTTTTSTTSSTTSSTSSTTSSTTTTSTTTSASPTPTSPQCGTPNSDWPGDSGCSSDCYCDSSESGNNYCTSNDECNSYCSTDSDCPGGFCTTNPVIAHNCGGNICEYVTGCSSTYNAKRSTAGWSDVEAKEIRARHVADARSAWSKHTPGGAHDPSSS